MITAPGAPTGAAFALAAARPEPLVPDAAAGPAPTETAAAAPFRPAFAPTVEETLEALSTAEHEILHGGIQLWETGRVPVTRFGPSYVGAAAHFSAANENVARALVGVSSLMPESVDNRELVTQLLVATRELGHLMTVSGTLNGLHSRDTGTPPKVDRLAPTHPLVDEARSHEIIAGDAVSNARIAVYKLKVDLDRRQQLPTQ